LGVASFFFSPFGAVSLLDRPFGFGLGAMNEPLHSNALNLARANGVQQSPLVFFLFFSFFFAHWIFPSLQSYFPLP
jgi:hypothetical protein